MKAFFTILVILFSATFCFAQSYQWDNVNFIQKPNQNGKVKRKKKSVRERDKIQKRIARPSPQN